MLFRLHRTRFLAEDIGILAKKLPVTFVKPELVRVFSTEVQDMVSSMQGLYARLRSVDSDLLCPSQPGTARVPLVEAPLKDRLESMEAVVRSMIDACAKAPAPRKGRMRPRVARLCRTYRFLCGHHEIVVQHARFDAFPSGGGRFGTSFERNVGLGKGTPPLSIPPKASEWWGGGATARTF